MENKKEMTIPNVSAATDAEQSLSKCTDNYPGVDIKRIAL